MELYEVYAYPIYILISQNILFTITNVSMNNNLTKIKGTI